MLAEVVGAAEVALVAVVAAQTQCKASCRSAKSWLMAKVQHLAMDWTAPEVVAPCSF